VTIKASGNRAREPTVILARMDDSRFAELISGIAHELRSPLTSVKGFSSTLVKRWDRFTDEQRFQFVETIHQDAERMARIVTEVVDLARLEADRLELHSERTEVAALVGKALDQLSDVPGCERVAVQVAPGIHAWGDPARLEIVLFNLIENAIKYSEAGPVTVTAAEADGRLDLEVSDEGPGIDPARIPGLFDGPGPPGQTATPSGTGLGLLLTRKLVEAHGGTISVAAGVPTGSRFTVQLPVEAPDDGTE
jgi:signal transduction histidine kinase